MLTSIVASSQGLISTWSRTRDALYWSRVPIIVEEKATSPKMRSIEWGSDLFSSGCLKIVDDKRYSPIFFIRSVWSFIFRKCWLCYFIHVMHLLQLCSFQLILQVLEKTERTFWPFLPKRTLICHFYHCDGQFWFTWELIQWRQFCSLTKIRNPRKRVWHVPWIFIVSLSDLLLSIGWLLNGMIKWHNILSESNGTLQFWQQTWSQWQFKYLTTLLVNSLPYNNNYYYY